MRMYIGKSIDDIVNRANDPMTMWNGKLSTTLSWA